MEYIAAEDSDARVLNPVALKCAGNNCCDLFFTTLVPKPGTFVHLSDHVAGRAEESKGGGTWLG